MAKPYIKALDTPVPVLAAYLRSRLGWASEFKRLRDPAAHRIPLFAVPGVATQQEADEFNTKWQAAMQLVKDGDTSAALATAADADQLGRYEPIFAMSGPAGKEVKLLREQIEADYEAFLQVSRAVIDSVTSEAA